MFLYLNIKIGGFIDIPQSYMILICVPKLKTQVWIKDPVVIIRVPMGLPQVCQTINNTTFDTADN